MPSETDDPSLAFDGLSSAMEAGFDRIDRRFAQLQQLVTAFGERLDRHFAAAETARAAYRVQVREMLERSRGPAQRPPRRSSLS